MVRCCGMGCRVWRGSGFWCRAGGWNGRMRGGWPRVLGNFWGRGEVVVVQFSEMIECHHSYRGSRLLGM